MRAALHHAVGRAMVLMALLLCAASAARADVWGFIDERGVAHFAASPLDARYELFFRNSAQTTPGAAGVAETSPRTRRLLAFFEISSSYKSVRHLMREAANSHNIEFELLQALIATESGFDASAVSPRGALGLMQIMPATAERYGVQGDARQTLEQKLGDPRTNIRTGSRYLGTLFKLFPGRLDLVLAAYNAGEGAVLRAGGQVPDFPETRQYVATVTALYQQLKPPVAVQKQRRSLVGGALGRGNSLPEPAPTWPAKSATTVAPPAASLGFIY